MIFDIREKNGLKKNNNLNEVTQSLMYQIQDLNDKGYIIKQVIPIHKNGETVEFVTITQEGDINHSEVEFCDIHTGEVFYAYKRTNVEELISILEKVDEFEYNDEILSFKGKLVKSAFKIINGKKSVKEALTLYFDLTERPKIFDEMEIVSK